MVPRSPVPPGPVVKRHRRRVGVSCRSKCRRSEIPKMNGRATCCAFACISSNACCRRSASSRLFLLALRLISVRTFPALQVVDIARVVPLGLSELGRGARASQHATWRAARTYVSTSDIRAHSDESHVSTVTCRDALELSARAPTLRAGWRPSSAQFPADAGRHRTAPEV